MTTDASSTPPSAETSQVPAARPTASGVRA